MTISNVAGARCEALHPPYMVMHPTMKRLYAQQHEGQVTSFAYLHQDCMRFRVRLIVVSYGDLLEVSVCLWVVLLSQLQAT